jgi:hypothetical protein
VSKQSDQIKFLRQAAFEALDSHPDGGIGFFKRMMADEPIAFMKFLQSYVPKAVDPEDAKRVGVTINVMQFGDKTPTMNLPLSNQQSFAEPIDVESL